MFFSVFLWNPGESARGEWLIEAKSAWQARRTHLRFSADLIPLGDDDHGGGGGGGGGGGNGERERANGRKSGREKDLW